MRVRDSLARLRPSRTGGALIAALLLFLGAIFALRPLTPFEWDEILFMRALDLYDPASHFPHPPGYPVYVALGRLLRVLVGDPAITMQLLSVIATGLAFVFLWRLARRLHAPPLPATAAVVLLAATPAFAFLANVGMSDVAGVAAAVLALLYLTRALEDPRLLPVAAGVVALAGGVRPQLLGALVPVGIAVLVKALRARRWGAIGLAALAGIAVSLACWLPPILISGSDRFFTRLSEQGRFVVATEADLWLPTAPIGEAAKHWLVDPFGAPTGAAVAWLLIIAGAASWWLTGARALVLVVGSTALSWLLFVSFTHNMEVAPRYVLPALPFLALLAAGVTAWTAARRRRAAIVLAGAWVLGELVWLAPTYALRHREPAPVSQALTFIRERFDPGTTWLVFEGIFTPHIEYTMLGPRARVGPPDAPYHCLMANPGVLYERPADAHSELLFLFPEPVPGGEVLFAKRWKSGALSVLTRKRYNACAVTRAPARDQPQYSPDFRVGKKGLLLFGTGVIALPAGSPPQFVHVRAGADSVDVTLGETKTRLEPQGEVLLPVWPVAGVRLQVGAGNGIFTRIPPIEFLPMAQATWNPAGQRGPRRDAVVPIAAHTPGRFGAFWVTDLLLNNPDRDRPVGVRLTFSRSGTGTTHTREGTRQLAAGASLLVTDVVAAVGGTGPGSLRLQADAPVHVAWRTYDTQRGPDQPRPDFLPAIDHNDGRREGVLTPLPLRFETDELRCNFGFVNLGDERTTVQVRAQGGVVEGDLKGGALEIEAHGSAQLSIRAPRESAPSPMAFGSVEFVASQPVFAYATAIENLSGKVTYVLARPRDAGTSATAPTGEQEKDVSGPRTVGGLPE